MREQKQFDLPVAEPVYIPKDPLTDEEKEGIILAVKSAFLKLKNLYDKITPVFDEYGFKAPSAGRQGGEIQMPVRLIRVTRGRTFK